ncbi:hypothetical protein JOQ06_018526, partial [Pogonophryne albipinna]
MQGRETYILHVQDKVQAFTKKIVLWSTKLKEGVTEMFPQLHQALLSSGADPSTISPLIQSHLAHLQGYFKEYFPDLEDNSNQNWIRNPFAPRIGESLDLMSQERLIDMANEWELKVKFQAVSLPQYWLYVKKDPALAERALKSLLPFATTYLCESGFSTLKFGTFHASSKQETRSGAHTSSRHYPSAERMDSTAVLLLLTVTAGTLLHETWKQKPGDPKYGERVNLTGRNPGRCLTAAKHFMEQDD